MSEWNDPGIVASLTRFATPSLDFEHRERRVGFQFWLTRKRDSIQRDRVRETSARPNRTVALGRLRWAGLKA